MYDCCVARQRILAARSCAVAGGSRARILFYAFNVIGVVVCRRATMNETRGLFTLLTRHDPRAASRAQRHAGRSTVSGEKP